MERTITQNGVIQRKLRQNSFLKIFEAGDDCRPLLMGNQKH